MSAAVSESGAESEFGRNSNGLRIWASNLKLSLQIVPDLSIRERKARGQSGCG